MRFNFRATPMTRAAPMMVHMRAVESSPLEFPTHLIESLRQSASDLRDLYKTPEIVNCLQAYVDFFDHLLAVTKGVTPARSLMGHMGRAKGHSRFGRDTLGNAGEAALTEFANQLDYHDCLKTVAIIVGLSPV